MASTQFPFLHAPSIRRYQFSQYTQGSVASFATQFNSDWAAVLPAAGAISIAAKGGAATVAEIVISPTLVLEVNPTDWVGYNNGVWQVVPVVSLGRSVADAGVTSASNVVTSVTAAFVNADIGAWIATADLPPLTTIIGLNSGISVNVSANSTATATAQTITITRANALFTPGIV